MTLMLPGLKSSWILCVLAYKTKKKHDHSQEHSAECSLLCEVMTLANLILAMPATNSLSERSFSQLRKVKTYLRSIMSQQRLNYSMILIAYQD